MNTNEINNTTLHNFENFVIKNKSIITGGNTLGAMGPPDDGLE